jgi:hypothetical protein
MFTKTNIGDSDLRFLSDHEFNSRCNAALDWIIKSIEHNNGNGSSAYYSNIYPPFGWSKAYPETTGYLISTLIDYDDLFPNLKLVEKSVKCADWICSLSLENGALPGGLEGSKKPSIFNTGQMLIGLNSIYSLTKDVKYYNTIHNAVNWLCQNLEQNGSWKKYSYIEGYTPSYYTRVVWPVLASNQYIKNDEINLLMQRALKYYEERINKNLSIRNWGFKKGCRAFTHTIAYTLRGFFESSVILKDDDLLNKTISISEKLLKISAYKGRLAGRYSEKWEGDYNFTCLTGNAQLSVLFTKIYSINNDVRFLNAALFYMEPVLKAQVIKNNFKYGAIAGSSPFHGRYLTLRYPNWATKFFLDAYLILKKHIDKL